MTLSKYARMTFSSDLMKIQTALPNVVIQQYDPVRRNYQFFGGPKWTEYKDNGQFVVPSNLPYFVICLYSMTLIDQTIHTHFSLACEKWDTITKYPKFGWCGTGCHHENPKYLILVAEEHGLDFSQISHDELAEFIKEQWQLFPSDLMIQPDEFFKVMLEDPDFQIIHDSDIISRFRSAIETVLKKRFCRINYMNL